MPMRSSTNSTAAMPYRIDRRCLPGHDQQRRGRSQQTQCGSDWQDPKGFEDAGGHRASACSRAKERAFSAGAVLNPVRCPCGDRDPLAHGDQRGQLASMSRWWFRRPTTSRRPGFSRGPACPRTSLHKYWRVRSRMLKSAAALISLWIPGRMSRQALPKLMLLSKR